MHHRDDRSLSSLMTAKRHISGLWPQGHTCYLNALLQVLFFSLEFRELVLSYGPQPSAEDARAVPAQLQRLFARMQLSPLPALSTAQLVASFGWDAAAQAQEHDLAELRCLLLAALRPAFPAPSLAPLFDGSSVRSVRCLRCGAHRASTDSWLDFPIPFLPPSTPALPPCALEDALRLAIAPETLDGDNCCRCERCDALTPATLTTTFGALPYFLSFSLARHAFDWETGQRFKINQVLQLPLHLDMTPYMSSTSLDTSSSSSLSSSSLSSSSSSSSSSHQYELFAVVLHAGAASHGHYSALLRDFSTEQWYHASDALVTRLSVDAALSLAAGNADPLHPLHHTSATFACYRRLQPGSNLSVVARQFPQPLLRQIAEEAALAMSQRYAASPAPQSRKGEAAESVVESNEPAKSTIDSNEPTKSMIGSNEPAENMITSGEEAKVREETIGTMYLERKCELQTLRKRAPYLRHFELLHVNSFGGFQLRLCFITRELPVTLFVESAHPSIAPRVQVISPAWDLPNDATAAPFSPPSSSPPSSSSSSPPSSSSSSSSSSETLPPFDYDAFLSDALLRGKLFHPYLCPKTGVLHHPLLAAPHWNPRVTLTETLASVYQSLLNPSPAAGDATPGLPPGADPSAILFFKPKYLAYLEALSYRCDLSSASSSSSPYPAATGADAAGTDPSQPPASQSEAPPPPHPPPPPPVAEPTIVIGDSNLSELLPHFESEDPLDVFAEDDQDIMEDDHLDKEKRSSFSLSSSSSSSLSSDSRLSFARKSKPKPRSRKEKKMILPLHDCARCHEKIREVPCAAGGKYYHFIHFTCVGCGFHLEGKDTVDSAEGLLCFFCSDKMDHDASSRPSGWGYMYAESLDEGVASSGGLKLASPFAAPVPSAPSAAASPAPRSKWPLSRRKPRRAAKIEYSTWLRAKVLVIGQEGVGKTLLVKAMRGKKTLFNKGGAPLLSTDGIAVHSTFLRRGEKRLSLDIWDFAGQELYYCSHQFFLTSDRSLYLLVFNLTDPSPEQRLAVWLNSLVVHAGPTAPVYLVGTHLDLFKGQHHVLAQRFQELSRRFSRFNIRGYFAVSAREGLGISPLKDALGTFLLSDPVVNTQTLPSNAFELEKLLRKLRQKKLEAGQLPLITRAEALSLTPDLSARDFSAALQIFHQLGICLYYGTLSASETLESHRGTSNVHSEVAKSRTALENLIILDAQWLIDVMAAFITTRHRFGAKGFLSHSDLHQIWKLCNVQLVGAHAKYVIKLLESFELILPLPSEQPQPLAPSSDCPNATPKNPPKKNPLQYFVPALIRIPAPASGSIWPPKSPSLSIRYQRIFNPTILPLGLLPRLMIRLKFSALTMEALWSQGCLVSSASAQAQTMIHISQDDACSLTVQVCSDNAAHATLNFRLLIGILDNLFRRYYLLQESPQFTVCPSCTHHRFDVTLLVRSLLRLQESALCPSCGAKSSMNALIPDWSLEDHTQFRLSPDLLDGLAIERELGKGAFGVVSRATWSSKTVAVKSLIAQHGFHLDIDQYREFINEIDIMARCDHPNILSLFGFALPPSPLLVIEYMPGGSLYTMIHERTDDQLISSPILVLSIAADIGRALRYLHTLSPPIVHSDLKSPNILMNLTPSMFPYFEVKRWTEAHRLLQLSEEALALQQSSLVACLTTLGNLPAEKDASCSQLRQILSEKFSRFKDYLHLSCSKHPLAKLADFGCSDNLYISSERHAIVENPVWQAPESLDSVPGDIYSYGMVLYELSSGVLPFSDSSLRFSFQLKEAIVGGVRPDLSKINPACRDHVTAIIQDCWQTDPQARPTISTILRKFNQIRLSALLI